MRRGLTAAVTIAAAGLAQVPAHAYAATTTFTGTCTATNVAVTHTPPMTSTPRPTHIDIAGDQLCSGVVRHGGRRTRIHDAPTPVSMHGDGITSCELSATSGTGEILLANRWPLRYHYLEPRLAPLGSLAYRGFAGGLGAVSVHPNQSEDLASVIQRCGAEGVATIHVDAVIAAAHLAG
ncbi:MAG: hypothetical protein ACJ760_08460 [Thermoleophilaceae bacterium]